MSGIENKNIISMVTNDENEIKEVTQPKSITIGGIINIFLFLFINIYINFFKFYNHKSHLLIIFLFFILFYRYFKNYIIYFKRC